MTMTIDTILRGLAEDRGAELRKAYNRVFTTFGPGVEWDKWKQANQQYAREETLLALHIGRLPLTNWLKNKWVVETSHSVVVPEFFIAGSLAELHSQIQELADSKTERADRPPIGELTFTERDDCVHAHFTDRHGKRRRFIRVRNENV